MLGKGLESLIPPNQNESGDALPGEAPREAEVAEGGSPPDAFGETIKREESTPTYKSPDIESEPKETPTGKKEGQAIFQIEVDRIKPNPTQPRKDFDEETLRELAASIREFGVIQPLIVSKIEQESAQGWSVGYELIAGERRLMAAKLIGLTTVPVIVRSEPPNREKLELAVIENIQRADLNPIELARAISRLQDEFGLTQREIATRLGKSREVIANTVRLFGLPTEIQEALIKNLLSESHARLLLSVDDDAVRDQVFQDILRENLNVRETDERIKRIRLGAIRGEGRRDYKEFVNPEIASLKDKLEEFLGTKVNLQTRGKSGKITINFYSPEELEAIVDKFMRRNDSQFPSPPLET